MNAPPRRGACPSLSVPMPTGDGLLVRLTPRHCTLSPAQLGGIARAAARHGNGMIEITVRGSLQVRGLAGTTSVRFAEEVAGLGVEAEPAPEIRTGPLAGLSVDEVDDPRPLADALRAALDAAGLAERLAPKLSIVVDGGGTPVMADLSADVRLVATGGGNWTVAVAGNAAGARPIGGGDGRAVLDAAMVLLAMIADRGPAARARDLLDGLPEAHRLGLDAPAARTVPPGRPSSLVETYRLRDGSIARGFVPAFGQVEADMLAGFAEQLDGADIRLAPGHALVVAGLSEARASALADRAGTFGMISRADDPRLRIVTCAGAPACGSAHLATKPMARAMIREAGDLLASVPRLHLAGCAKQCAKPGGPLLSVLGGQAGAAVVADRVDLDPRQRRLIDHLAGRFGSHPGSRAAS